MKIDLNADLGEGSPMEQALLPFVTSANIACGAHAGSAEMMLQSVRWAKAAKVRIGAHPGYDDKPHFGRRALNVAPEVLYAQLVFQIGALQAIASSQDEKLWHVKPHGMLYNQAAVDRQLADTIARAVKDSHPQLLLVGLAGSELLKAAEFYGLATRAEVFADRRYQADGQLVSRTQPQALISEVAEAVQQSLTMVTEQRVFTLDGTWYPLVPETICLHGDGEHALEFAQALYRALQQSAIEISAD